MIVIYCLNLPFFRFLEKKNQHVDEAENVIQNISKIVSTIENDNFAVSSVASPLFSPQNDEKRTEENETNFYYCK